MGNVERLFGEGLDNVGLPYEEGLNDCAEGQELKGCGVRHDDVVAGYFNCVELTCR